MYVDFLLECWYSPASLPVLEVKWNEFLTKLIYACCEKCVSLTYVHVEWIRIHILYFLYHDTSAVSLCHFEKKDVVLRICQRCAKCIPRCPGRNPCHCCFERQSAIYRAIREDGDSVWWSAAKPTYNRSTIAESQPPKPVSERVLQTELLSSICRPSTGWLEEEIRTIPWVVERWVSHVSNGNTLSSCILAKFWSAIPFTSHSYVNLV